MTFEDILHFFEIFRNPLFNVSGAPEKFKSELAELLNFA